MPVNDQQSVVCVVVPPGFRVPESIDRTQPLDAPWNQIRDLLKTAEKPLERRNFIAYCDLDAQHKKPAGVDVGVYIDQDGNYQSGMMRSELKHKRRLVPSLPEDPAEVVRKLKAAIGTHRNVLRVVDLWQTRDSDPDYVISPWYAGGSLHDAGKYFSRTQLCEIVRGANEGLYFLNIHQSLLHHDVYPKNILVDISPDGSVTGIIGGLDQIIQDVQCERDRIPDCYGAPFAGCDVKRDQMAFLWCVAYAFTNGDFWNGTAVEMCDKRSKPTVGQLAAALQNDRTTRFPSELKTIVRLVSKDTTPQALDRWIYQEVYLHLKNWVQCSWDDASVRETQAEVARWAEEDVEVHPFSEALDVFLRTLTENAFANATGAPALTEQLRRILDYKQEPPLANDPNVVFQLWRVYSLLRKRYHRSNDQLLEEYGNVIAYLLPPGRPLFIPAVWELFDNTSDPELVDRLIRFQTTGEQVLRPSDTAVLDLQQEATGMSTKEVLTVKPKAQPSEGARPLETQRVQYFDLILGHLGNDKQSEVRQKLMEMRDKKGRDKTSFAATEVDLIRRIVEFVRPQVYISIQPPITYLRQVEEELLDRKTLARTGGFKRPRRGSSRGRIQRAKPIRIRRPRREFLPQPVKTEPTPAPERSTADSPAPVPPYRPTAPLRDSTADPIKMNTATVRISPDPTPISTRITLVIPPIDDPSARPFEATSARQEPAAMSPRRMSSKPSDSRFTFGVTRGTLERLSTPPRTPNVVDTATSARTQAEVSPAMPSSARTRVSARQETDAMLLRDTPMGTSPTPTESWVSFTGARRILEPLSMPPRLPSVVDAATSARTQADVSPAVPSSARTRVIARQETDAMLLRDTPMGTKPTPTESRVSFGTTVSTGATDPLPRTADATPKRSGSPPVVPPVRMSAIPTPSRSGVGFDNRPTAQPAGPQGSIWAWGPGRLRPSASRHVWEDRSLQSLVAPHRDFARDPSNLDSLRLDVPSEFTLQIDDPGASTTMPNTSRSEAASSFTLASVRSETTSGLSSEPPTTRNTGSPPIVPPLNMSGSSPMDIDPQDMPESTRANLGDATNRSSISTDRPRPSSAGTALQPPSARTMTMGDVTARTDATVTYEPTKPTTGTAGPPPPLGVPEPDSMSVDQEDVTKGTAGSTRRLSTDTQNSDQWFRRWGNDSMPTNGTITRPDVPPLDMARMSNTMEVDSTERRESGRWTSLNTPSSTRSQPWYMAQSTTVGDQSGRSTLVSETVTARPERAVMPGDQVLTETSPDTLQSANVVTPVYKNRKQTTRSGMDLNRYPVQR